MFAPPAFAETESTESIPVLTGTKIVEYGMYDSKDHENLVHQLHVGKQYWFEITYQNQLETESDLRVLVQLLDQNKTEKNIVKKIDGHGILMPSEIMGNGFTWVPEYAGDFKITAEVISLEDPLVGVVAPQYDLIVIDRPTLRQQLQDTIPFDEIQCRQNMVLIQKYDGMPACVTESTKLKLVERGWTESKNFPTSADSQKLLSFLEAGQVEEFNKLNASLNLSSNPFLSLNGTNLQGLDLRGIDLTRVHIAGTDMQNSNLQGIVLDYKNIKDTNLQGADLTGADLSDTYLNNVNLQNANMKNANLKNIHLADSNIDNANLMGADLHAVNFQGVSMIDTNFEGANMQSTNLSETNLNNLNFQNANIQFANLKYANLSNANLENTNLSNTNLENANLRGVDLYGSDLNGAILKNANLLDTNLTDIKNLPISVEEARQRGAIVN